MPSKNGGYNLRNMTLSVALKLPDRYLINITHDQLRECLEQDGFMKIQIDDIVDQKKTIIEIIEEQRAVEKYNVESEEGKRVKSKKSRKMIKDAWDAVPVLDLDEDGQANFKQRRSSSPVSVLDRERLIELGYDGIKSFDFLRMGMTVDEINEISHEEFSLIEIKRDEIDNIVWLQKLGWNNRGWNNVKKALILLEKGAIPEEILEIDNEQFLDQTIDDLMEVINKNGALKYKENAVSGTSTNDQEELAERSASSNSSSASQDSDESDESEIIGTVRPTLEELINQPGLSEDRNPCSSPLGTGHRIVIDKNNKENNDRQQ